MNTEFTHTVTVTIGRKIGGKTMDAERWSEFKREVAASLAAAGCKVVQRPEFGKLRAHDQVGEWEGQREGAATFVALISGYKDIRNLKTYLAVDAVSFGQLCIGCVVTLGVDHLVWAEV